MNDRTAPRNDPRPHPHNNLRADNRTTRDIRACGPWEPITDTCRTRIVIRHSHGEIEIARQTVNGEHATVRPIERHPRFKAMSAATIAFAEELCR